MLLTPLPDIKKQSSGQPTDAGRPTLDKIWQMMGPTTVMVGSSTFVSSGAGA
jgi:hypothetical protein